MKKNDKKFIWMPFVVVLILGLLSCENPLDEEFPEILIINQPPKVSQISGKILKEISLPKEFDLGPNVKDQENEALLYTGISRDLNVVEASFNGSILILTSIGIGTTVVDVDILDPAGNLVVTTVDVEVQPGVDLDFVIDINFDVADGDFAEQMEDVVEGVNDIWAGEPSSAFISSGAVLIGPAGADGEEWAGFEMWMNTINVSETQAIFEFKYADVSDPEQVNILIGAGDEFSITMADLGQNVVLNDSNFNTIQVEDLQVVLDDLGVDADLSSLFAIGFYTEAAGNTFRIDDVKLGLKE